MKQFRVDGDEVTISSGRVYCGPMRYLAGMVERSGEWEAWFPPARLTGKASSVMAAATLIVRAWQAWRDEAPASMDSAASDEWEEEAPASMDSAASDEWEEEALRYSRRRDRSAGPGYPGGPELANARA